MKTGPTLHPAILNASVSANAAEAEIRAAAEYLKEAMKRVHSGKWDVHISHEHMYVLVKADLSRAA